MQSPNNPYNTLADTAQYHPDFSSQDGDIILASKDCKVLFRAHTYTLKTTSGFFRSMFGVSGTSEGSTQSKSEIVYLNDDAEVLEHMLRMICGLPLLPLNAALAEAILHAAEAYEMPGPISIIRLAARTSPLSDDPLHMFVLSSRYGWEEEMRLFSSRTLAFNLHDPIHFGTLAKLPSKALLNLFALHRGRRESLRKRLNDPPFVSGGAAVCLQCQGRIEYSTWRELKYKIILEIDERPLGDTILQGLTDWPEAVACWQAVCPNIACHRRLYDKAESFRVIQECIGQLPDSVDSLTNSAVSGSN